MLILAPPSADRETVMGNLAFETALFRDQMAPAIWDAFVEHGVDPVGGIAQSKLETGGLFLGDVKPANHNTAGIKWHDELLTLLLARGIRPDASPRDPLAFTLYFAAEDWYLGATVHAEHLKYGWVGVPVPAGYHVLDPRYKAARSSAAIRGDATTWESLGGRWAPSETYGTRIEDIMHRLSTTPDV